MTKIDIELLEAWLEELEEYPITFDKYYQEKEPYVEDDYIYGHFGVGDPPFYEGMVAEVFEMNHQPKLWVEVVSNLTDIVKELIELKKYKMENEMSKEFGIIK